MVEKNGYAMRQTEWTNKDMQKAKQTKDRKEEEKTDQKKYYTI